MNLTISKLRRKWSDTAVKYRSHAPKKLSGDHKTLLRNFGALSVLQGLNMILPLITLPYVLRIFGAEKYGVIVLANSLLMYFQGFADFSFNITATRDVAVHRHSKRILSLIYSRVLSTKAILVMFSFLLFLPLVLLVPQFAQNKLVFLLTFPALAGYALFPDWFFQGVEEMKVITILSACIKIFFTVCIFVFIRKPEDFFWYPLFQALGYIGAGLYAQYLMHTRYRLQFRFIGFARIKEVLRSNFSIFINQFLPNLYNNSTTFLLGILTGTSAVGVYGAAKSLIEAANAGLNILSRVFFPFLNRRSGAFGKFQKLILAAGIALCAGICVLSIPITKIFHLQGREAVWILCIMAISVFFMAMYYCYGTNYFIVKRADKLVMKNTLYASITGFVMAFPLIMLFSGVGAAINLAMARGMMGVGLWWKYKTEEK
ncbi:oligosaccharide flippase family protein [Chitinophaga sp. CB10]|uniref:oligosaccharide flippase family protein n=1 Tax=Chitinophaga sp. CB10 TaxID=1891659 RepID=UPI000B2B183D|nr:oligosaccharide flippase family protein [Chitinophaga sp. CB10]